MECKDFRRGDGTRIVYEVTGEGPPVLLLHGFTMSAAMWRENGVIEALSGRFRLILPDLAGHGASDKPTTPESYGRAYLGDIEALCQAEAGGRVHLAGFSMGAELALAFAAETPDRVASLFLCGSGWSSPDVLPLYGQFSDWARSMPADERPESWDLDALEAVVAAVGDTIPVPRDRIEALRLPAHGLVGGNDPERTYLDRLTGVLDEFTLDVLPGVSHEASWKDPRFAATLSAFLDRTSGR